MSQSEIEALRGRADILAIIGAHVQLKQDGREYVGRCPFHDEKTASFKVDSKKNGGVYICFGCGAKGDVFRFVQMIEGLDFPKAVERVRELAGVPAAQPGRRLPPAPAKAIPKVGPVTAVYPYLDEKGNTLFEVCRHEPGEDGKSKSFRQRVPVRGGYSYSVKGVRRVLYRLPQVLAAAEVWICEGEKDVHTLEAQGLVATTNAGGARAPWLQDYTDSLAGKTVFLVPDNDDPGRERGAVISRAIPSARTVSLPEGFKDVTDFIEAGNSAHDLRALAEQSQAAIAPETHKPFAPLEAGEKLNPNDIARLILRDHTIMSTEQGFVYEYNHRIWERTTRARLAAYAMAYDTHNDTKAARRKEAADYVITFSHVTEIHWRRIGPNEIPVYNGVYNLDTGTLRNHRREDYLEAVPAASYIPGRECPTWLAALEIYWGLDPDYKAKVSALQEFFGYCLMTHARYKKALMITGESDTGKSQVLNVIRILLGNDNICCVPLEVMDDSRRLTPLMGKMVNLLAEVPSRVQLADGGFKTLVSGEDPISINPKYEDEIAYISTAKHVIACNQLPRVTDHSRGIFNRLLLIKFNHVIPAEVRDRDIATKLRSEREGILAWALEGARRLNEQNGQFTSIPESDHEIADYRDQENPVNAFIAECCAEVDEEDVNPVLISDFAAKLSGWAGRNYDARAVGSMLRSAGRKVEKQKSGPMRDKRCVFGLELLSR